MKKKLLGAALAVCLSFTPGCANDAAGGGNTASGSVGVSSDDALVYAVDSDLDVVFVVDTKSNEVVNTVKVGRQPEKVLVAPDDTVYVTNRLGRSVSVIRRGEGTEATRIDTAVEPVGLAISADGKTLYVVNATSRDDSDFGTLMAFDTATLTAKWETPVGAEPRGITLLGNGKLAISLYKEGDLVFVDATSGKVTRAGTGVFEKLNASALGITAPGNSLPAPRPPFDSFNGPQTSRPRGVEAITVSPDGRQIFAASLIATDAVLQNTVPGSEPLPDRGGSGSSGYGGGGNCGTTAVASAALLTFDADGNPLVDDVTTCIGTAQNERPPMLLTTPIRDVPIQGPRAVTVDTSGRYLFIANFESNNVSVVLTSRDRVNTDDAATRGQQVGTVSQVVNVGNGPTGVALSRDGKKAWVYNSFDHSLSTLQGTGTSVSNIGTRKLNVNLPSDQQERLSPDALAGRRLFFSASDARMNNPATGISCGTCHLEGREDGHVWNFTDGPRQTPSLQGRMMMKTAPFHWNGEFPNLLSFMTHTVSNRMGGSGVSSAMELQIAAFIESMPPADNPHQNTTPADVIERGQAAFNKAECGTCHGTETFTDNTFADVGTYVTSGPVPDNMAFLPHGGLNTPSLLGLARTAPYLHDGSAQTLKARIMTGKNNDRHGRTSVLNDGEVDDLVAYLKTL